MTTVAVILIITFAAAAILLAAKVYFMKKSAREIGKGLREKLQSDTNTLIDISSADRDMRALAALLNSELSTLRTEQRRYVQGDKELKEAITNISHDLRTPLTAICGYLDLLEKCAQSDEIRQYLAQIKNRAVAMRALTEELFRYSVAASESELSLEMICVNDVLEECLASYYGAISERGITPQIDIAEERVQLIADRSALMRIFSNLISNALKYSRGDLSVSMKTAEAAEDSPKRRCGIVFANSAENIKSIEVNRLFDRFYTVEDGNASTGLGLSIAKLLTEKLGGEISADIVEDKLEIRIDLTV